MVRFWRDGEKRKKRINPVKRELWCSLSLFHHLVEEQVSKTNKTSPSEQQEMKRNVCLTFSLLLTRLTAMFNRVSWSQCHRNTRESIVDRSSGHTKQQRGSIGISWRADYLADNSMTVGTDTAFAAARSVFVWMRAEDWRVTHAVLYRNRADLKNIARQVKIHRVRFDAKWRMDSKRVFLLHLPCFSLANHLPERETDHCFTIDVLSSDRCDWSERCLSKERRNPRSRSSFSLVLCCGEFYFITKDDEKTQIFVCWSFMKEDEAMLTLLCEKGSDHSCIFSLVSDWLVVPDQTDWKW